MSDTTVHDDDDLEDDGESLYEFVAGGESCEICKSLDGVVFPAEPARPHASCDCDIVPVQTHDSRGRPCGSIGWYIADSQTERYGEMGRFFMVTVNVVVTCANGLEWQQQAIIDFADADQTFQDEDIFAYMDAKIFNETSDLAEMIGLVSCPPCAKDEDFTCV